MIAIEQKQIGNLLPCLIEILRNQEAPRIDFNGINC